MAQPPDGARPPLAFPALVSPPPPLPQPAVPFPDPIPGLIPFGTLSLFIGATGAGKTTMAVPWVSAWLNGGTICGYPTNKPTALSWITADRPGAETTEWFTRQGINPASLTRYSVLDDPSFPFGKLKNIGTIGDAFEHCLNATRPPPGSLVIFDPLTPLFIMGDGNKARDVALTLITYTKLCMLRQITMICMGHFGKQKGGRDDRYSRPQDRIAGSNAFGGYSSTQIYLLDPEPGESQVWTLGWVPRQEQACQFTFVRDKRGFFAEVTDSLGEADTAEATLAGRRLLLTLLPTPPSVASFTVIADQIMTQLKVAKSTTFKYRKWHEERGHIELVGRGQLRITAEGIGALASGKGSV